MGQNLQYEEEVARHVIADKDSCRETLMIRLQDAGGGVLTSGQRCYFGYTTSRYRRVTGISLGSAATPPGYVWPTYGLVPPVTGLKSFTLTLVARDGKSFILENFPVSRLSPLTVALNFNYGGKIVRFDMWVDMQSSFVQYNNPGAIGAGYILPLTFSFAE